ncbi:integrase domain-containing protein [Brumicola nitratireducens]|uniref:Site-specific recombinase, phage integrase family protein n=1 Tax=Glaciecola nitratireducens (strain JCM 12485 / KCTC 12276 / FR1064) TaxID=1085623 RepID=G4QH97_GLANF|nr:integrase domain-containing protein [Glaciecola nitratireducens]AEP29728.1 site-specific recombinase, phage integrase family protein [Glaciecola nitratireducens FR1064]
MPRVATPLTDSKIQSAKPREKDYKLSDGRGLHLRVRAGGTKDWIFRYQVPFSGTRKDMSFGIYPTVGLADAREKRKNAHKLLSKDIDPKSHKAEVKRTATQDKANSFTCITLDWLRVKSTKVTAKYAVQIEASLRNHVFPHIGKRPVKELTPSEVIEFLRPIEAKGSKETIKRLCQRINEVMDYAVNTGLIDINPLSKIHKAFLSPNPKHLPTIKPEELPQLMQSLSTASIKLVTRTLIEWQLHTMVRPSEAATAKWSEIDLDNQTWTIPADKMKKKNNGDHVVPLTPQTLALLDFIKPISGHREFIFPADRNPKTHTNTQTANMALKRMGYHKTLVAHGLRSLASTTLNERAFAPDVIEACLAHIDSNSVRRAYNRTDYLERRRKVMNWWSAHVEQAATGNMSLANTNKTLRLINN